MVLEQLHPLDLIHVLYSLNGKVVFLLFFHSLAGNMFFQFSYFQADILVGSLFFLLHQQKCYALKLYVFLNLFFPGGI